VSDSRISGLYKLDVSARLDELGRLGWLSFPDVEMLKQGQQVLRAAAADKMVENVIGRYSLPLGIGANFLINGRDYLVPMVVEEPSVVAAVSYAAKLARPGGGFRTGSTEPIMIAQVQLLSVVDPQAAESAILAEKAALLELANTSPTIASLGGGPVDIEVHHFTETPTVAMMVVHVLFDTRDAMGANAVNTAAETIAPALERLSGGTALLRILSNLTDRRRAWAEVTIPAGSFSNIHHPGEEVIASIAHANAFAVVDPYRAATHNKGILNGIDAVAVATGNDWRAIEAGAHAYAARDGRYRALTEWKVVDKIGDHSTAFEGVDEPSIEPRSSYLCGRLEVPLSVGIVGGATRSHPVAQVAMKVLNVATARELSEVMVAVGLAQNLAALRALATEGIQRGHMSLHARQVAVAAGATGNDVDRISAQLVSEGQIRVERARELLLPSERAE
jgi:hydroxymethylglutaryl-CoA reductase